MPEDVCIDKVEPVDCCRYDNEELEVFIVRLVKIVYAAVGVVGVAFELGVPPLTRWRYSFLKAVMLV